MNGWGFTLHMPAFPLYVFISTAILESLFCKLINTIFNRYVRDLRDLIVDDWNEGYIALLTRLELSSTCDVMFHQQPELTARSERLSVDSFIPLSSSMQSETPRVIVVPSHHIMPLTNEVTLRNWLQNEPGNTVSDPQHTGGGTVHYSNTESTRSESTAGMLLKNWTGFV